MKKIILIIFMAMISSFSYYGAVNEKREKVVDFTTSTQEENKNVEETPENIIEQIENTIAQAETTQNQETKTQGIENEKITTPIVKKSNTSENNKNSVNKEATKTIESKTITQPKVTEKKRDVAIEETPINKSKNQNSNTNNVPKCSHSNSNWYNSKVEAIAIYNAEIKKWGDKWTNYEIDNDTYYKNCPSGYEVFSCLYCNKWTINLYY